jgi:hypothetical protein
MMAADPTVRGRRAHRLERPGALTVGPFEVYIGELD